MQTFVFLYGPKCSCCLSSLHLLTYGPHIIFFLLRFFSNRRVYPQPRWLFLWPHPASATSLSRLPSADYPLPRFSCAALHRLPSAKILMRRLLLRERTASASSGDWRAPTLHPVPGHGELRARTLPRDTDEAHLMAKGSKHSIRSDLQFNAC